MTEQVLVLSVLFSKLECPEGCRGWDVKPTRRRGEGFSVGRARCVAMQCSMRLCGRPTVPVDTNDRLREKFTLGVKETPSIVRILSPEPTVAGRRARRGTLTGGRACVFLRTYPPRHLLIFNP